MGEAYRQTADRVLAMLQRADGNDPSRGHLTMNNWEWPTGVALYGIYKTWQQSGDPAILDYLKGWYGDMLSREQQPWFPGPKFGLPGLREAMGVRKRAFTFSLESWSA